MEARRLSDRDCITCSSPVLAGNPLLPGQDSSEHCSQSCRDWSRSYGRRPRPRKPCQTCRDPMHPAYAVEGTWCSMRCRTRALAPELPDEPPPPGDWAIKAACRDAPTELFFAEKGDSYRAAVAVCDACPVQAECLEYALAVERGIERETYGVWGGLTPRQRVQLARQDAA